jgi:hypothetical protein
MQKTQLHTYISSEAKAWLNRDDESSEVIRVVRDHAPQGHQCYRLYPAYDPSAENIGRLLFDAGGYWIYDGNDLSVGEQEQVAAFIMNYVERI